MKNNTNNPEDENRLVHLINVGSFIRLKRVKKMVSFFLSYTLSASAMLKSIETGYFAKDLNGYTF